MNKRLGALFLATGLAFLLAGVFFGALGGLVYLFPQALRDLLPFAKLRPLHVSSVVFWILFAAIGGLYFYQTGGNSKTIAAYKLGHLQYLLLLTSAITIVGCYLAGIFGGREYWEFPPAIAIPIAASFLLLAVQYYRSVKTQKGPWPIYRWMWATGIVFFLLSFTESYLWLIPYFRDHLVRDMAVQWKSYGSLVGSWNMLINGGAFFLMARLSGDERIARRPLTFFFFFLGLFNLMFNWGHHIYALPVSDTIRNTAYLVSMTELLILGKIIWSWRSSLSEARKNAALLPYRFMIAADFWIFLNLSLAILMSIPAINLYTHGTHITVAHAMGTTIGINTMLLLASACYACTRFFGPLSPTGQRSLMRGLYLSNGALLVFWVALIGAGVEKAVLQVQTPDMPHGTLMQELRPWFVAFTVSGVGIAVGMAQIALPLLRALLQRRRNTDQKPKQNQELLYA